MISINQANGLPISARAADQIQRVIALGLAIGVWFGIAVASLSFAGQLAWIRWQTLPRTSSGATKNGMAHV